MAGIGERLRETREERGLTQEQVSAELHVTLNTIARWERGEMFPKGLYLEALLRWLADGTD